MAIQFFNNATYSSLSIPLQNFVDPLQTAREALWKSEKAGAVWCFLSRASYAFGCERQTPALHSPISVVLYLQLRQLFFVMVQQRWICRWLTIRTVNRGFTVNWFPCFFVAAIIIGCMNALLVNWNLFCIQ